MVADHARPGSPEAELAFCKIEARRAGLVVFDPAERKPERYRK